MFENVKDRSDREVVVKRVVKREKAAKGTERRKPLSAQSKARIRRYARALTWLSGGRRKITHLHLAILEMMLKWLGEKTGQCDLSHERVAEEIGCNPKTVGHALARLERAGIVTWCHRWIRLKRQGEWRVHRTSNGYVFSVPDATKEGDIEQERVWKTYNGKIRGGLTERDLLSKKSSSDVPPEKTLDAQPELFVWMVPQEPITASPALLATLKRRN
jgi:hypothetical protein